MAKNKTTETDIKPLDFIDDYVENDQKRKDSLQLIQLMEAWSGAKARMWGPTIVGFGKYHYKYKSGHEGEAPLIGFSPRKAQFSFYIYSKTKKNDALLQKLGKFKMGESCIYVKKLEDIDVAVLEQICLETIHFLKDHFE